MYQPSQEILDRYADILVNFALRGCKGIRPGEVVLLQVPECAKPMLYSLRRSVLSAGAHALVHYIPDDFSREFYELANDEQLAFFPATYLKGRIDQIDHMIAIVAETDKHELEGIPAPKLMARQRVFKPYVDWRDEKENAKKFSWTMGMYGTEAMAKEVGLSLEEYWEEIIQACYLDFEDPVKKWKELTAQIEDIKNKLDALQIQKVRIQAEGTDLVVGVGNDRRWLGASGRNVPSFEIFISPDWRQTQGYMQFTEPLYSYGHLIKGVRLEFKDGVIVKASAQEGEELLLEMIGVSNADRIGEFSLTDARFSRITRFMGETLYDENVGGKFGNTHIAIGRAYKDSYKGDIASVPAEQWDKMGFNESVVHTDIVATSNRRVTAFLPDGSMKVIYEDGKFTL